jgi:hypothetical protein
MCPCTELIRSDPEHSVTRVRAARKKKRYIGEYRIDEEYKEGEKE